MAIETRVVPLQATQFDALKEALARAFFDDPLMAYLVPDDARRQRALPWFMGSGSRYGHRYGEVFTTGAVEGGAVWLPPGQVTLTLPRMLRSGMLAGPFKMGFSSLSRSMTVMNIFEHLHKRDMPMPHWYLMILGVDPPRQGQGVGGALIQPILARADADGLPCYLETQKEINVTFYRKHGFDVVAKDDLPKGGPHYWTMRREAKG